ncbi:YecA family protein [Emticicia sp. CRIBPO]|uniref:YecA family protein n=1 Tax=Emticicia sp. CRIBPO TaxID=2683258 RepID=UPI00197AE29A|nr:SEC-C domain-containing protein [Emticicia sp. CRIBPO]
MSKVERNDPCPCGSGKKFKKCCIDILGNGYKYKIENTGQSKFTEYLKNHESGHILDSITSLQLIPENYGKNCRIEKMAIEAVKNLRHGNSGNINDLNSIIKNYPRDFEEDAPEDLFTDNVQFVGGNYIVMPGINSYSVEIFTNLSESIFKSKNDFSKEFKNEIYEGVALILNLGAVLFDKAKLDRNLFVENYESKLRTQKPLLHLHFTKDEILDICEENNINPQTIDHFVIDPNASEFLHDQSYLSPLLFKPLVNFDEKYFMILPSCQMSAINGYILQTAKKYNVRDILRNLCQQRTWMDIWSACEKMGWFLTSITLPEEKNNICIKEGVFELTENMLCYVCYVYPNELKNVYEWFEEENEDLLNEAFLNERIDDVITKLKKELSECQFLTLVLTNTMGGVAVLEVNDPLEEEQRVSFNVFDFLHLAYSGELGKFDLWKYGKVYESTSKKIKILSLSSIDAYATYKNNGESFYLSDQANFNFLSITPGSGANFVRQAKINSDLHGVLSLINGFFGFQSVRRYGDHAPIYKPIFNHVPFELLLKSYDCPIWIQNFQAKSENDVGFVEFTVDAVCFWLDKVQPALGKKLNLISPLLNIVLEFEDIIFDAFSFNLVDSKEPFDFKMVSSFSNYTLTYKVPKVIQKLFIGGDNSGERILMSEILRGFNSIPNLNIPDSFIEESLNAYMPLGQAKMILIFDTRRDMQLDTRWLLPPLYISDAEVNLLLDNLPDIIDVPRPISKNFESVDEKKRFCNKVVTSLVRHLVSRLSEFDNNSLLRDLMCVNESLIQDSKYSKLKTSAQIHCFGNNQEILKKIFKKEKNLLHSSISTRCLIEFIVLNPATGKRKPSFDHLDELLTIMNIIINYGMLSDTLHFGMDDPEIVLLPSGRIGISKEFYDDKLQPFQQDNIIENIETQLEIFSSQFDIYSTPLKENEGTDTYFEKVNEAFLHDWGVKYDDLTAICLWAAEEATAQGSSVISMLETELITKLNKIGIPLNQLEAGLKKLSFKYREGVISDGNGYTNVDYFPWKYNREFSYARKPFIVLETEEGRGYFWGMRHCISAGNSLHYLLNSGRLSDSGSKIKSLLGEINRVNGKKFRNDVLKWIKDNTTLLVWDYELTIKPGGHFNADKDYGDCDIMAYDTISNQVYNIECKRTEQARNIHQMKNEMDDYIGRPGQKKKIAKHEERDNWLKANINQVKDFVNAQEQPTVTSLIITSELIPTRYLRSEEIALPILSFRELKKKGLRALEEC